MLSSPQYCTNNDALEQSLQIGNSYSTKRNFTEAFSHFQNALNLYEKHLQQFQQIPTSPSTFTSSTLLSVIHYKIALCLYELENYELCLEPYLEQALANDPNGYANACILKFNALWKLNSCVQALITVHVFLNQYPNKSSFFSAIFKNLKNSNFWFLDDRVRIVKVSENNYCMKALEDIPMGDIIEVVDEEGKEYQEQEGICIVKDSLLFPYQIITDSTADENLYSIATIIIQFIKHFDLLQRSFKGLHPRKLNHVPKSYAKEWTRFLLESIEEIKENLNKEEYLKESEITFEDLERFTNNTKYLKECVRMLMIIKLNSFTGGVYGIACLFNHSCEENCEKIDNRIVTTKAIKAGDDVCLNYLGYDDNVKHRRIFLKEQFQFDCHCPKCERELLEEKNLVVVGSSSSSSDNKEEEMIINEEGGEESGEVEPFEITFTEQELKELEEEMKNEEME
ncbi:hypothetical protein ABK040_010507 [Willaertia magna]